ncbi:sulfate permease [Rothia kristinae]|uniref:sulfate permease n=1 Tax=Rothia kristinae TaxID=37923 RepID=UPI0033FC9850
MIRLTWNLSQKIAPILRAWLPTNVLRDAIRTRRGLKWGLPCMLLAAPYLYAAAICRELIEDGGPGWLNLLVILFIWNTFKMLWIGPTSLIMLILARRREHTQQRQATRETATATRTEDVVGRG